MLPAGKNILVLTYWNYRDALIQTYTLPYLKIILKEIPENSRIILVTLETQMSPENDRIRTSLSKERIDWITATYRPFGLGAIVMWLGLFMRLMVKIFTNKIYVIHCWGVTAGAAGCILALMTRRKLVIDSYEPHAEAMVENGTWKKDGLAFRILFYLEKLQSRNAHAIISATAGMKEYAKEKYGIELLNFEIKPACVDLDLFSIANVKNANVIKELGLEGKIVCVYAGKFGGIYLGQEVFDFFKIAHQHFGPSFRILLLTNHGVEEIKKYCSLSDLDFSIVIIRFVPHHNVPDFMGVADFAISPVKPVPTKRFCTPIKDGEYWALGLPVVIPSNISDDSAIISENSAGAVLRELNSQSYYSALEIISSILQQPQQETFLKIRAVAEKYRSFAIARKVYHTVYGGN